MTFKTSKIPPLALACIISLLFISSLTHSVLADNNETFIRAESIIEAQTPCDQLNNEDLEALGDYYMEQVHPDYSHEIMDNMMGGEDSESLKLMHRYMGIRWYCDKAEPTYFNNASYFGNGMMGGGMMGNGYFGPSYMSNYQNSASYSWLTFFSGWITQILLWILLVIGIIAVLKYLSKKK